MAKMLAEIVEKHFLQSKHNNVAENKKKQKPRVKKTTEVVDHAIVRKSKKDFFTLSRNILNDINFQF